MFKGEKKLYFVAETKSHTHYGNLRSSEWQKITCRYRHFGEFEQLEFMHVKELKDLSRTPS